MAGMRNEHTYRLEAAAARAEPAKAARVTGAGARSRASEKPGSGEKKRRITLRGGRA